MWECQVQSEGDLSCFALMPLYCFWLFMRKCLSIISSNIFKNPKSICTKIFLLKNKYMLIYIYIENGPEEYTLIVSDRFWRHL